MIILITSDNDFDINYGKLMTRSFVHIKTCTLMDQSDVYEFRLLNSISSFNLKRRLP